MMQKAKDYIKQWTENPTKETLVDIMTLFIAEIIELSEMRKSNTDSTMISILDEQNRKWKSFTGKVKGISINGFHDYIRVKMPEVYTSWFIEGSRKKNRGE